MSVEPLHGERPDWRAQVFTAAALRTMAFPPVSYVISHLIPEGLAILAGRPKIGKSWMVLDLAISVATGQKALGGTHVTQGDVLYCALEDNPRRLQRRITKLLSPFGQEWPERLTLATRWRRLDQGGVEDIEAWCDSVPNPRLVLLDTLAGVRPMRNGNDTLYDGDYKALRDVHGFANERGIGVVALHHTRKMEADDPVDTISGSLGIAGAADTCLVLARSSKGTTLYVRGRDIEESERAVVFAADTCRWSILGDAADVQRSDTRKAITAALLEATAVMSPAEIASLTTLPGNTVHVTLHRMAADSEVVQVSRGKYAHPSKDFAAPRTKCKK
jgi:AAA domain